jgi:hypothetical protein
MSLKVYPPLAGWKARLNAITKTPRWNSKNNGIPRGRRKGENTKKMSHARSPKLARVTEKRREKKDEK